jgi:hypothetical protein
MVEDQDIADKIISGFLEAFESEVILPTTVAGGVGTFAGLLLFGPLGIIGGPLLAKSINSLLEYDMELHVLRRLKAASSRTKIEFIRRITKKVKANQEWQHLEGNPVTSLRCCIL